jgi:hypothetical protein
METKIAKAVRIFRKELAEKSSTFFLVYTDVDVITNQILTKVTSNSTPEGISAILSLLLEPTEQAIKLLAEAGVASDCTFDSVRETRIRELCDRLCKLFAVKGIAPTKTPEAQS